MILYLQQLQDVEDLCVDLDGQQCDFPADAGKIRAPIHLEAHVRKVGSEVTIAGRLSTQIEMLCARCLKPHKEILSETFEVVYCPQPGLPENVDDVELDGGELDGYYYEGETISLLELVRDQMLLMIPVKPLCQPDCAGLCPSCGRNLNKGPCECPSQTVDSRLAVLGKLLKEHTPVQ
jgi:uncharacterized protein